jgi:hypothetical protein
VGLSRFNHLNDAHVLRPLRFSVALLALAIFGGGCGAHGKTSTQGPYLVDEKGRDLVRPERIEFQSENPVWIDGLRWSGWGSNTKDATGRGVYHINSCDPDCGAGHYKTSNVEVRLIAPPAVCGARRQYLLMWWASPDHPQGELYRSSRCGRPLEVMSVDTPPPQANTAPNEPRANNRRCAVVEATSGDRVRVVPTYGNISCAGAAALWRAYPGLARQEGQGSGGYVELYDWGCISARPPEFPDVGGCERLDRTAAFEVYAQGRPPAAGERTEPAVSRYVVSPEGDIGRLALDQSQVADVQDVWGQASLKPYANGVKVLTYACRAGGCETDFLFSAGRLRDFQTSDPKFHTPNGTHVGMPTPEAERRERRGLTTPWCPSPPIVLKTIWATLSITVDGKVDQIEMNSGRHPIRIPC